MKVKECPKCHAENSLALRLTNPQQYLGRIPTRCYYDEVCEVCGAIAAKHRVRNVTSEITALRDRLAKRGVK